MTPPLIVPDTNVFISGATISQSPPSQILELWRTNDIQIATSLPILDEIRRVLEYPRVRKLTKMNSTEIRLFISSLLKGALVVSGTTPVSVCEDPDDNKFFACAVEAQADYIVSGDPHILKIPSYKGVQTITPRDFIDF